MKFSCDHCQKRFSTEDEPVPGRVYRIPCRCGHTIVLQADPAPVQRPRSVPLELTPRVGFPRHVREPAVAAEPAWAQTRPAAATALDRAAPRAPRAPDELSVLLGHASDEVTPTWLGPPLARSDRHAEGPDRDEEVAEALRRTGSRSLALGAAAGVPVGVLLAVAFALIAARLPSREPAAAIVSAAPVPGGDARSAPPLASPEPVATPAPRATDDGAPRRARSAPSPRRTAPAPVAPTAPREASHAISAEPEPDQATQPTHADGAAPAAPERLEPAAAPDTTPLEERAAEHAAPADAPSDDPLDLPAADAESR